MKQTVNSVGVSGPRKKRRSVAQILRESYALIAKDEVTLMAVKMVLGSAIQYSKSLLSKLDGMEVVWG